MVLDIVALSVATLITIHLLINVRHPTNKDRTMFTGRLPRPDWVYKVAPAKGRVLSQSGPLKRKAQMVTGALEKTINKQVLQGSQLGVSVAVALDGEVICTVVGGVRRTKGTRWHWMPVKADDLFMSWSLCKGVAASALLKLVDQGKLTYDQRVTDIWPEFNRHSHPLKGQVTIGEAISHRAGLLDPIPIYSLLMGLRSTMDDMWRAGLRMVEDYTPRHPPGTFARYVPVMWSWVIGGVVEKALGGKHIKDVVNDEITEPLHEQGNMYLGCLPPSIAISGTNVSPRERVVLWEKPRLGIFSSLVSTSTSSLHGIAQKYNCSMKDILLGAVEGRAVNTAANSSTIERHCFPSSNGFFTATAIVKLYAALANDGRVGNIELFSKDVIDHLVESISNSTHDIHHPNAKEGDPPARMSLGFCPWSDYNLHKGASRHALYHAGIGGCFAFADPESNFAICVMRNSYLPLSVAGASVGLDEYEICDEVRKVLEIE